MSILDTFFILFKTDADKAVQDIKDVDKASDGAEKGLRKMDAAASKVGASFVGLASALAAPIVAMASLTGVLSVVQNRIEEIGTIGDDALKLRSSPQDYDAFTRAVRAAGGEMAAAQANLTTFAEKLNDAAARASGPNAKNFAKWGIAFKDAKGEALGAVDGLLALAKSLENVSRAEALGRLKKLGIEDADTIDFLLQGKEAIVQKMQAEKDAGVVTDEQIELEGRYQAAVGKTRNLLDSVAGALTERILPIMIKAYETFNTIFEWIGRNRVLVTAFFTSLAAILTTIYAPAMWAAARATWAALAPLLVTAAPFIAIAAAVTAVSAAIALAIEDVWAFINGQPSALGELVKKYQWVADTVDVIGSAWRQTKEGASHDIAELQRVMDEFFASKGLADFVANMRQAGRELVEALKPFDQLMLDLQTKIENFAAASVTDFVDDMVRAFNVLSEALGPVIELFIRAKTAVSDFFGAAASAPAAAYGGATPAGMVAPAGMGGATVPAGSTPGGQMGTLGALLNGKKHLSAAGSLPAAAVSPNGKPTVNNTSTVNVGDVTVNTQATDAAGMAAAVRGELGKHFRGTAAQFDDGVDR